MDKINFRIVYGIASLFITLDPNKLFMAINPNNQDYIIPVDSISFANKNSFLFFFSQWLTFYIIELSIMALTTSLWSTS